MCLKKIQNVISSSSAQRIGCGCKNINLSMCRCVFPSFSVALDYIIQRVVRFGT